MNLYFVFGSAARRGCHAELTGALLPGVTRSSILQVAEDSESTRGGAHQHR